MCLACSNVQPLEDYLCRGRLKKLGTWIKTGLNLSITKSNNKSILKLGLVEFESKVGQSTVDVCRSQKINSILNLRNFFSKKKDIIMSSKKLTLYHFPLSGPSRAALLTMRNLKLDFEIKIVNLIKKEQLNDDFVKINPQHCVPTLVDEDGFVLWESKAISQYLVETRSPDSTLLPKDPKQRAILNQRLFFDLGTLYARIRAIAFPALFLGETTISDEKRKQLTEAFEWSEKFLEGQKWFAGENITIADLSILASISSVVHAGADISKYKNLSAWYERCRTIPGYDENDAGAKEFGQLVKSKLKDTL